MGHTDPVESSRNQYRSGTGLDRQMRTFWSIAPLLMHHGQAVKHVAILPPLRNMGVHQGNKAGIVRCFKQMRHFVDDDIFQALGRLLGEIGVQANAAHGQTAWQICPSERARNGCLRLCAETHSSSTADILTSFRDAYSLSPPTSALRSVTVVAFCKTQKDTIGQQLLCHSFGKPFGE